MSLSSSGTWIPRSFGRALTSRPVMRLFSRNVLEYQPGGSLDEISFSNFMLALFSSVARISCLIATRFASLSALLTSLELVEDMLKPLDEKDRYKLAELLSSIQLEM